MASRVMTGASRRRILEALRASPALMADVPADTVNIDGLLAHLAARGFEGGVHIANRDMEGLVWVQAGEPQDPWFFDGAGGEAVLARESGLELLREMAGPSGTLSLYHSDLPVTSAGAWKARPSTGTHVTTPGSVADAPAERPDRVETHGPPIESKAARDVPPTPAAGAAPVEVLPTRTVEAVNAAGPDPAPPVAESGFVIEPPARPWPRILWGVAARVERHRGSRLAQRFLNSLGNMLEPHGGRVEPDGIIAPPLSESTWRVIVEAACAPIVAVAGRAFLDRTIAAAERDVGREETP